MILKNADDDKIKTVRVVATPTGITIGENDTGPSGEKRRSGEKIK